MKANKGKKIDDPFTRRSTKPTMVFKSTEAVAVEPAVQPDIVSTVSQKY